MSDLAIKGVTCQRCGGTVLHSLDSYGKVLTLEKEAGEAFVLIRIAGAESQRAVRAIIYKEHECP